MTLAEPSSSPRLAASCSASSSSLGENRYGPTVGGRFESSTAFRTLAIFVRIVVGIIQAGGCGRGNAVGVMRLRLDRSGR